MVCKEYYANQVELMIPFLSKSEMMDEFKQFSLSAKESSTIIIE